MLRYKSVDNIICMGKYVISLKCASLVFAISLRNVIVLVHNVCLDSPMRVMLTITGKIHGHHVECLKYAVV